MAISSTDCKDAIINFVNQNPGYVAKQFGDDIEDISEFEAPAKEVSNWKRVLKEKTPKGLTERMFDCRPYGDQLRGYTYDDGNKIVKVKVQGE